MENLVRISGVRWSEGFKRLWLVFTALCCVFAALVALNDKNLQGSGEASDSCILGTVQSKTEVVKVGSFVPTPEQVRDAIRTNPGDFNELEDGTFRQIGDPFAIEEERKFFSCTTYTYLIGSVLLGIAVSLAVGVAFLLAWWIIKGFRKSQ